ncbi:MAG: 2-amino-4-hydroxy-6-hydroxymethyldihydropteridine diphosphokinase [Cyanobacteria bacterium P01_H01_bin.121]
MTINSQQQALTPQAQRPLPQGLATPPERPTTSHLTVMTPAAIALGSNLGDSPQIIRAAIEALHTTPGLDVTACSSLYRTAPMGPPQPDYCNACVTLNASLEPQALLHHLLAIEAQFGRVRRERWGPRLLDLDLLFYGQLTLETPALQVPHPRLYERAFVLIPLSEIAADWIDPISGQAIAQLARQIESTGIETLS